MYLLGHRNVSRHSGVEMITFCRRRWRARRNCVEQKNEQRMHKKKKKNEPNISEQNDPKIMWPRLTTLSSVIVDARSSRILNIARAHILHNPLPIAISTLLLYRETGCCRFHQAICLERTGKGKRNGNTPNTRFN